MRDGVKVKNVLLCSVCSKPFLWAALVTGFSLCSSHE